MRKLMSLALTLVLSLALAAPIAAAEVGTSGNTGSVPVALTAEAAAFSVTVPTSIPMSINSDAEVTCATNLSITNNTAAPVEVTSIEVQSGTWSIVDYNGGDRSPLAAEKVNSNKLGLALKPSGGSQIATSTNGTQSLSVDSDEWVVSAGGSLSFQCSGIATAVSGAIADAVQAAKVVFTIGWSSIPITGYEIQALENVMDEDGNVALKVGEAVQLEAVAVYSLDTPTWSSSNTGVVEITQDGLATAIGAGESTITYTMGEASGDLLFKVTKNTQSAPSAPTLLSRTADSISLNTISGCEYSINGSTWQDSPTFSELSANTQYTLYARYKETSSHYASSPSSVSLRTDKASSGTPTAPTMASRTDTSITLNTISGCEYSINGTSWQDSTTFGGLSPATAYTFYARYKETDSSYASASSSASISTDKSTPSAPSAPTMASRTDTSITLNTISGCEYSINGTTWQDSTTFSGLSSGTTYTFYARYKETSTSYASVSSSSSITTNKAIISFIIGDTEYQAEEGMTWGEWVNSTYNTGGFITKNGTVYNSSGAKYVAPLNDFGNPVNLGEVIIDGKEFMLDRSPVIE